MFILDVEGFERENFKFVCKEISILDTSSDVHHHIFVKSPVNIDSLSYKISNYIRWYRKNVNGLDWENPWLEDDLNTITYENITQFIKQVILDEPVYVRDCNIKNWLRELITNEIINLKEEGCIPVLDLKNIFKSHHCLSHSDNNLSCTSENVHNLHRWLLYCKK